MKEVYDNGEKLAEYRHTPGGMLLSQRHGPLQVSYGYDRDKNLTALKALSGNEILADNLYEYDGNGNRTKKRQMEGETQYIYDGLNQLTKIEYPTLTEELFYDKAGNRTRRIAGDEEDLYSYDPRNRLVSHTRSGVTTPLVYDDAGNLLRDGRAIYEYDGFNRAVKAETFDGNIQVNRYDAEGLRYELEENGRLVQFIFHQSEVITEQNETDTIRLIRGYDLIASDAQSARTYYHYASDEVGSTTHIVDEKGKVLNHYVYDAFGNITEQKERVPNRFKFNGQQYDPITQQYYLRARFYNPVVARFTQEDVYHGDGLNLYAYCHNNPVVYADPSGYVSGPCNGAAAQMEGQRDRNGQTSLPISDPKSALPKPGDDIVKSANEHLGEITRALYNGTPLTPEQTSMLSSYAAAFGDSRLLATDSTNPLIGAMANQAAAVNRQSTLPKGAQNQRTVLSGTSLEGQTIENLSGLSGTRVGSSHLANFETPGITQIDTFAQEIGRPIQDHTHPFDVNTEPGYTLASHTEKQVATVIVGDGGTLDNFGVTRPICGDCAEFTSAVSHFQGTNIYAVDTVRHTPTPNDVHVFLPDGTHIQSHIP